MRYTYSEGIRKKHKGEKIKIKRVMYTNQTLIIMININKNLRLKDNEERKRLLYESLENLKRGLQHFINVSSDTKNFNGRLIYESINKVLERIKIYVDNELVLEISLTNKFRFNISYFELEDVKATLKYNVLNYSKDRREKMKFDNAVMLLYAISVMLKNYYESLDNYAYIYNENGQTVDEYILKHIDEIELSQMTWRT